MGKAARALQDDGSLVVSKALQLLLLPSAMHDECANALHSTALLLLLLQLLLGAASAAATGKYLLGVCDVQLHQHRQWLP